MPVEDRTLGAWHLADNPDLYEIQRTNNFEFVVTGLDNLLRPSVSEDSAGAYIKNAQEVLRISVLEASIPHFTQNVIEIKRGNTTIKAAGTPTYDSGTLRLYDFIGADTKSALMAWQVLSFNEGTEKVGKMSLIASRDNLNNISIKVTNIDGLKTTGDTRYVIFDKSLTAAGIYSGKFTFFYIF